MRSPLSSVFALAALSSASALSRAALPAEKCVVLSPYRVAASDAARFEQQFASSVDAEDSSFLLSDDSSFLLLRRRNDVNMYGKLHDSYPAGTPDYQAMSVFADACCADGCSPLVPPSDACEPLSARPRLWDATIVQRPLLAPAVLTPGTPLFLAMNRFPVRADCALDFEERWASRNSKLGSDGVDLLGFSLLRRRAPIGADETYTYSTATLWASEAAWGAWREGVGSTVHDASKADPTRTPVSEWMSDKASPIFWDVPVYVPRGGPPHVCVAGAGAGRASKLSMSAAAAPPSADEWLGRLASYRDEWGNADPPLNTELGQWCAAQRRRKAAGRADARVIDALEALEFSWTSPTDNDDPLRDWEEMCARFEVYRREHGDGQIPKKYKLDPKLGGWVAAVRRNQISLGVELTAQLDAIGFEWESTRQCGSAWQQKLRELREFFDAHGHTEVGRVLGDDHELAKWCVSQRAQLRAGTFSKKRATYLADLGWVAEE